MSILLKSIFPKLLLSGLALALAACSSANGLKASGVPLLGSSVAASTNNSVLTELGNGLLGTSIGQLASADRRKALEAEYKALEYSPGGKAVPWKGASGSAFGDVVAATPYQVGSQNCRQYTHSFTINGAPQTSRGTACRNADGSWTPLT